MQNLHDEPRDRVQHAISRIFFCVRDDRERINRYVAPTEVVEVSGASNIGAYDTCGLQDNAQTFAPSTTDQCSCPISADLLARVTSHGRVPEATACLSLPQHDGIVGPSLRP